MEVYYFERKIVYSFDIDTLELIFSSESACVCYIDDTSFSPDHHELSLITIDA